jgi:hypothetical protein
MTHGTLWRIGRGVGGPLALAFLFAGTLRAEEPLTATTALDPGFKTPPAPDPGSQQIKEIAETVGDNGGRPIEKRSGKQGKASEFPEVAKVPGVKPDDDIKMIHDPWMGADFPVNLTLAREWNEVQGGDAIQWTGKVAPSVKPGMVITPQNYKSIPDLEKLLAPQQYARLDPNAWDAITEIRVGETDNFFPPRPYIEATKSNKYTQEEFTEEFTVPNWKGGMPFPKVDVNDAKAGEKILINYLYRYWVDDGHFPFDWHQIGASDNLERTIKGLMFFARVAGRANFAPPPAGFQQGNEDVLEKIATLVTAPKDIRGIALARTRYLDIRKADSLQIYLPALRRIRRLSGRDTQDPLVGTDVTWDDYVGFYQQVTYANAEVKLVGETEFLHPSSYSKEIPAQKTDNKFKRIMLHNAQDFDEKMRVVHLKYQRRPIWIIDVISKDPSYMYSKRRLWVDKQTAEIIHAENYDRKGNLYRVLRNSQYQDAANGENGLWDWTCFSDQINKHRTCWHFDWTTRPGLTTDYFDTPILTKMTQ